mgnify:CR=1 FL=1
MIRIKTPALATPLDGALEETTLLVAIGKPILDHGFLADRALGGAQATEVGMKFTWGAAASITLAAALGCAALPAAAADIDADAAQALIKKVK